jgi:hypothetical protein
MQPVHTTVPLYTQRAHAHNSSLGSASPGALSFILQKGALYQDAVLGGGTISSRCYVGHNTSKPKGLFSLVPEIHSDISSSMNSKNQINYVVVHVSSATSDK